MSAPEFAAEFAGDPEAVAHAFARAVDDWGGAIEGSPAAADPDLADDLAAPDGLDTPARALPLPPAAGCFQVPARAGLRYGLIEATYAIAATGKRAGAAGSTALTLVQQRAEWRVDRISVGVLALAAAGGLSIVLWPLVPSLGRIAPLGGLLAVAAWFLVLARLRSAGLEEFLDTVGVRVGEAARSDRPADLAAE